jgi:FkbM family methyltransferase
MSRIKELCNVDNLSNQDKDFLWYMKKCFAFEPQVIYDIGSCTLDWYRECKLVWPQSRIIAFDANKDLQEVYAAAKLEHQISLLSNVDGKNVKYYFNNVIPSNNSYYKNMNNDLFPCNRYVEYDSVALDTLMKNKKIPYPDLIKINVQGSELDVLQGSRRVLKNAKCIIIQTQDSCVNLDAPTTKQVLEYLEKNNWSYIMKNFSRNENYSNHCLLNGNDMTVLSNFNI